MLRSRKLPRQRHSRAWPRMGMQPYSTCHRCAICCGGRNRSDLCRVQPTFGQARGATPPTILLGRGENIPFRAETFDWVIIWSALQYMNIDETFRECSRVLRPGGYVLASAPLLYKSIFSGVRQCTRTHSARPLVATTLMVVNTMWYQAFHTRLRRNIKGQETARPVHVTKRYLAAVSKAAGLRFRSDLSLHLADRLVLVLQKSAAPADL